MNEKIRQKVYELMVRLPAATANSPKHGQPGQTSGENGVKTPCVGCEHASEKAIKKKRNTWRREGKKGLT